MLTFGILFSTVVNAEVIAKPLILAISVLISFIFVLRTVLVAHLVISGILSSIFFIFELCSVFLTTSFLTTLLNLLKSTGTGTNLSISDLSTLFLNCLNYSVKSLIYQYLIYQLFFCIIGSCGFEKC